ncbi:hypothetical protein B6N60_02707 [Richelia sinica FACHB-800]|uniref:Uncharacterized protein n=1 Tax=Richelia sinica FACHB-800 TaxID=1357546 RepID=A0A975T8S1_9NOST|nr:hypothetical protein B6N60_02707 [Richelia sinica FACHB-800]
MPTPQKLYQLQEIYKWNFLFGEWEIWIMGGQDAHPTINIEQ